MAHAFMPVSKVDFSTFPSSDGLPMAENDQNRDQMVDLISTLKRILNPRGHYVTGNMLLYYNQHDGWEHFSPDVFVALDAGAHPREKWQTWIEGKFPEVVFEILSPSTRREDFGRKVTRYHELGAREYYLFDIGEGETICSFQENIERRWPREPARGASVRSPLLGLEFAVLNGWLRVLDPETGEPVPSADEEHLALLAAESRLAWEHAARVEAEARAAEAERAMRAALAELARLRAEPG